MVGRPPDDSLVPPSTGADALPASAGASGSGTHSRTCQRCGTVYETDLNFCPRDGAPLGAASPEDLIGQVLADRFRVVSFLGEGGMGMVYLAEHVRMGRRCAVKLMRPQLVNDADSTARFTREASNASRIAHPNVATIFDFGETAGGLIYLAMEYVDGPTLAMELVATPVMPVGRAVEITRQTADALAAAHDLGIVHRDLKPDNVMLARARDGRDFVKVVDFGIAKAMEGGEKQQVTRTGFVIGTPDYMSPEQLLGTAPDGRSDLYSLGCMLYRMLTGQGVFGGQSGNQDYLRRLSMDAPSIRSLRSEIPDSLDALLDRLLARQPENRFQSAAELRDALASVAAQELESRTVSGDGRGNTPSAGWRSPLTVPPTLPTPNTPSIAAHRDALGGFPPTPVTPAAAVAPTPVAAAVPTPSAATLAPSGPATPAELHGEVAATQKGGNARMMAVVGGLALFAVVGYFTFGNKETAEAPPSPPSLTGSATPASTELASTPTSTEPATAVPAPVAAPAVAPTSGTASRVPQGTLRTPSDLPKGAQLTVDGRLVVIDAQGRVALSPGRHELSLSAPGYAPATSTITITDAGTTRWSPRLERPTVVVESPGPASTPVPQPAAPAPVIQQPVAAPVTAPVPTTATTVNAAATEAAAAARASAAEAERAVGIVASEYTKAIAARDLARMRELHPSMSAAQQSVWKGMLDDRKNVRDFVASISPGAISVTGGNAEITVRGTISFRDSRNVPFTLRYNGRASLTGEKSSWRIRSIDETMGPQ